MDGTGTTRVGYDALSRVTDVTRGSTSVGYDWNRLGQPTDVAYPSGKAVHRTYDAAGQLTKVRDWTGGDYLRVRGGRADRLADLPERCGHRLRPRRGGPDPGYHHQEQHR
ncbi:hypothetical protein [Cellulomonas sp. URHE0023]|uniref:hypothetical protein n=1 Tax=Cellulomonas sp. URHE0023 TaxID=1380354 RepID=UPI00350EC8B3